jgi:hypothetical protein
MPRKVLDDPGAVAVAKKGAIANSHQLIMKLHFSFLGLEVCLVVYNTVKPVSGHIDHKFLLIKLEMDIGLLRMIIPYK